METMFDDMDDLIGKVLAGEATEEEAARVEAWRNESEANKKYVEQLKAIFNRAGSTTVQQQFDTDAAWNKVRNKIHPGKDFARPVENNGIAWKMAAGIVFALGIGFLAYQWNKPVIETFTAASSETTIVQDSLPDGSTAVLNKKSTLRYEYSSKEKVRKVSLTGEAYFSVKHGEAPFVIETDEILIRDIGTEFNVSAYPDKDTIEIVVTQGEVQFYTLKDPGLLLKAGEKGIYSKRTKQFYRLETIDANDLAYKTKIFRFTNTEMTEVVKLLNDVYGSRIRLASEAIYTCRLTANYSEDNPDRIVEVIAETMGFTLTRKDGEILLDGKGCNNE